MQVTWSHSKQEGDESNNLSESHDGLNIVEVLYPKINEHAHDFSCDNVNGYCISCFQLSLMES